MPSDSPEAAVPNPRLQPTAHENPTVETEFKALGAGEEEVGAVREREESVRIVEEKQGRTKEVGGKRRGRRAGKANARSDGSGSKSREGEGSEEEEEAVAVIAQVLMEKFGPQIVREEVEEGAGFGAIEGEEEVERGEEEAETEGSEEGSSGTTSRSTRTTSRSSLRSFYRFFSSHLGISSPISVASLLASNPQLLRSNPTNDFLPRVRLLQSYGVSHTDIVRITAKGAAWLRVSLPRIQNRLDFLLAQGVRRSRLGLVLRRGSSLLCEARSMNLDILVERAGVPVDKLGLVIEKCPDILTRSKESVNIQLETLLPYLQARSGGKLESDSTSTTLLKQQPDEPQFLISAVTPSIVTSTLWRAPTIFNLSRDTLLAKLKFLVGLVGEEATGRVVRSYPHVLVLSKENVQGKVVLLADLIGQENAVRAVTLFPSLVSSSKDGMRESFRELVREVEEALENSGGEGSGPLRLGGGDCLEEENRYGAQAGKRHRACRLVVDLVVKFPQAIYISWEANLKHKVEYLKRDMGLSIVEMLAFPQFVTYSLDRRIRPRHVALLRTGYEVVAREMAIQRSGGKRDVSREKERSMLGSVSDEVEGVERIEWGAEEGKSGPLFRVVAASDEPGERVVTERQLLELVSKKMVCLQQFLHCTDKHFEEKFGVTL